MHPAARRSSVEYYQWSSSGVKDSGDWRAEVGHEMRDSGAPRDRVNTLTTPAAARFSLAVACATAALTALLLAACGGGKPAYDVSVAFNDRYTDAAGQAVEQAIHEYDAKANVILQTSFPPVAHATVHTNAPAFCDAFRQRLMSRTDIARVDCQRAP